MQKLELVCYASEPASQEPKRLSQQQYRSDSRKAPVRHHLADTSTCLQILNECVDFYLSACISMNQTLAFVQQAASVAILATKNLSSKAPLEQGIPLAPSEKDRKPWYSDRERGPPNQLDGDRQ